MNLNTPNLLTKSSPLLQFTRQYTPVTGKYSTSGREYYSRMASKASLKRAEDFTTFLNASPTPFHAVETAKQRLEKAGFKQIKVSGCSYASSIPALAIPSVVLPASTGIDLKIKPNR